MPSKTGSAKRWEKGESHKADQDVWNRNAENHLYRADRLAVFRRQEDSRTYEGFGQKDTGFKEGIKGLENGLDIKIKEEHPVGRPHSIGECRFEAPGMHRELSFLTKSPLRPCPKAAFGISRSRRDVPDPPYALHRLPPVRSSAPRDDRTGDFLFRSTHRYRAGGTDRHAQENIRPYRFSVFISARLIIY